MPEEPQISPEPPVTGRLAWLSAWRDRINAGIIQQAVGLVERLSPDPAWLRRRVRALESGGWRSISRIYLLAAVLITLYAWTGFPNAVIGGGEQPDWAGTMWAYWWTGHALLSGLNPFDGTYNFFPVGQRPLAMYNLLDALLAAPLIQLFGPILGFNLFTVFILWSTAMGVSAVVRASGGSHGSGLVAGLAVISSTYMVMELVQGRQSQAMLVFWMLALAGLVTLARGEGSVKTALWTGAATALTFLGYWYAGIFLVLAAGAYWLAWARRWDVRRGLLALLAVAVCLALCAPFLWSLMQAYADLPGVQRELDSWMDYGYLGRGEFGLNMVIRGSHWPLWPFEYSSDAEIADRRIAYGLLGMALAGLWMRPRRLLGWWLVLLWGYVLSLGPYLKWSDGEPLPLALPYLLLYDHLPFFERLWWPDRLDIIVFVALAVLAALHLDAWRQRWPDRAGLLLVLGIGAVFVDVPWRNRFLPLMVGKTRPVSRGLYSQLDGPVLTAPVLGGEMARHILWMQVHHEQPTTGGLGEHLPAHRPPGYQEYMDGNELLVMLADVTKSDSRGGRIRPVEVQHLIDDGLRWAVVDPWTFGDPNGSVVEAYRTTFTALWGEPDLTESGVSAWRIEPIMAPVQISLNLKPLEKSGDTPGQEHQDRGTDGQH
jgi:hypothetical protein